MDNQRSTGQQPSNRYDQVQRTSTSSSDRSTAPYSSSRIPVAQRPTGRYGQDQRPTEDSSQSSSSDYSAQRRQPGQPSANQYGQRQIWAIPTCNQRFAPKLIICLFCTKKTTRAIICKSIWSASFVKSIKYVEQAVPIIYTLSQPR